MNVNRYLFFLLSIFLFFGCQENKIDSNQIEDEIRSLTTIEAQTSYLEMISDLDQKYRLEENTVTQKYGHNSKEWKAVWNKITQTDKENLLRIEKFFEIYGHPKNSIHSEKACGSPYIVIHHQPNNGSRKRYFPILYKAYLEGDLNGGAFTFYLNRMYDMRFNERITYEGSFTEKFEIDTLTNALNLQAMVDEVQREVESSSQ